jgi:hypothetical protein
MIALKAELFESFLLNKVEIPFKAHKILVTGRDALNFLQGQLTSDLTSLGSGKFQFTARLDRSGRIKFVGLLSRNDSDSICLHVPSIYSISPKDELEKFIIADDVQIVEFGEEECFFSNEDLGNDKLVGNIANLSMFFYQTLNSNSADPANNLKVISLLGFDFLNSLEGIFLNESTLIDSAYSKSKGCFLGQEAIAKLASNRSAPRYPVLLYSRENEQNNYEVARLSRDQRALEKYKNSATSKEFYIQNYPIPEMENFEQIKSYFLGQVVNLYLKNETSAEIVFRRFYKLYQDCPEIIESYASFLLNKGNLEAAHEVAHLLSVKFPEKPMGYALKSIILMRQGKIEQAEQEKAKSLSLSFGADEGKNLINKGQGLTEIQKRRELFKQVLDLDPEDSMALYGMLETSAELGFEDYSLWLSKIINLSSLNKNKMNIILPKLKKTAGKLKLAELMKNLIDEAGPHSIALAQLKADHLL